MTKASKKEYTLILAGKQHGYHKSLHEAVSLGREKKMHHQEIYGTDYSFPIEVYRESPTGGIERVHEE